MERHAPWSEAEVQTLNRFQSEAYFHPFTCPNRSDDHTQRPGQDLGQLVATTEGWVCLDCDYVQLWAHEFMFDNAFIDSTRWWES